MEEKEIFELHKRQSIESHEYFSNRNKSIRERYCVDLLLNYLDISHDEGELVSQEISDKVDVKFRDASFQVKELIDTLARRNDIYKNNRKSFEEAESFQQLKFRPFLTDVPNPARMCDLVDECVKKLSEAGKYKARISEIDLLLYITRRNCSLFTEVEVGEFDYSNLGWRSVSCVNEKQAVILYTSKIAPNFLLDKSKQIFINSKY